jgi:DNA-binding CsgD family transcriptional regulator
MSPPLTHEEHLQVLECIQELHGCRSLAEFPRHSLAVLKRLVPSDLSAFNEVNMPRGRIVAVMDRHFDELDEMAVVWERHSAEHPLVRYIQDTGDGQAVKISDFLSDDEYHRLAIYREFFAPIDAEDQMSITIRSDRGVILALAFNRPQRDFTENDRIKLNLIRPHVLQAYANAEELTGHREEKDDLHTALRETGHGLIAVDARGTMIHATPGAPECLTRFFPDEDAPGALPAAIADWAASEPHVPFTLHAPDATLIVRSPRDTTRRLLLLSEERRRPLPKGTRLTPRETEVLHWIAAGKSNAEIATILTIAAGTVKLHVQSILGKLGVENRTAAAAAARERGLLVAAHRP